MDDNSDMKGTILIVFILIMFSSKLWTISFSIVKSLLYLVIGIYIISYLNPKIGKNIQESLQNIYNIDSQNNIFRVIISKIALFIMNILNPSFKNKEKPVIAANDYSQLNNIPDDLKFVENKNLDNYGDTNNKLMTP